MPCYIIRAGDTPNVKLGWADQDPQQRCRDLQCGCWEPLRIIRLIEGPRALEGWLHRYFAAHRGLGEWFTFQPEMMTVTMAMVAPEERPKPFVVTRDPHSRPMDVQTLIDKAGGAQELAAVAGVSRQRVQDWKRENAIPGNRIPAICEALGVAPADLMELVEAPKPRAASAA